MPNAPEMFAGVLPAGNTMVMQVRLCTGCPTTLVPGPAIGLPYWVKLVRSGTSGTALTLDTAASITPGNYVFTVTGQSGTVSHSGTATLIANQFGLTPLTIGTMSPAAGSAASGTLSVSASDPNGVSNVGWIQVLINGSLDGEEKRDYPFGSLRRLPCRRPRAVAESLLGSW